jgi:hypothetical protein
MLRSNPRFSTGGHYAMAISPDISREILRHIKANGTMPESLPGVDQEDLHNEFTRLWRAGLITSDREPIVTGTDHIVRDVIEPRLTDEGQSFLNEEED